MAIGALIMVPRQINNWRHRMRGVFSESSKASARQVLVYSLVVMLLAPALALILTTTQVEVVAASPDETTYDFKGDENHRAWEEAIASAGSLTNVPLVPSLSEAESGDYNNIENTDDARWETTLADGRNDEWNAQYFKFDIEGDASQIDNIEFLWEGFGKDQTYAKLYVWGNSGGSWSWVLYNEGTSDSSDENLENTITLDIANYIYENSGESQFWLAVKAQGEDSPAQKVATDYVRVVLNITMRPTQPTLYLPSDGDNLIDNTPYFEWTLGENADNHRLLVWITDNEDYKENRVFLTDNYYTIAAENALLDDNYSWSVTSINENGETASSTWTFAIKKWMTPLSVENVCGQAAGAENIYVIDDNLESYWFHSAIEHHWITFDMGSSYTIRKIRLYQSTTESYRWGTSSGLTVYVSDNLDNWSDNVWEGILNAEGWQENGNSFEKIGRWIKLVSKNDTSSQRMYEFDAYVGPILPTQPILYLPADGSATDNTPYFEWENGAYTDNHRLLVDNDPDFSSPEEDRIILNDNNYTIANENDLPVDNYSWKVIAINQYGENESDIWTFQVFELFYPENSSMIVDRTPKFLWNERPGATFYWFYLDNDSNLENEPHLKTKVYDNFYQIPWSGFITNGTWYWKVIASDSSTTSVFNFVENGAEVTTEDMENITESSGDLLASIVLNALDNLDIRFRYKSEYQYQTEGDTFVIQDYSVPDPPDLPAWRQENVLIAASDSSQEDKDAADNICPGPDENEVWYDEDTIQAVLTGENITVYLFDGTYYCGKDVSAEIIITYSRLSLIGESKENVIIRWKPLAYSKPSAIRINAENAENFLFENFTLAGPGRTFPGEFSGLHVHSPGNLNGSIHDVVVRNIKVENFQAIGIYFERSATEIYVPPRTQTLYNCWAINCEINEVGAFGLDAGGYVNDSDVVHVWNIYFDNIWVSNVLGSTSYGEAGGAHLHRLDNSMIVNCTFENIGGWGGISIAGRHFKNNQILGNKFERCGLIKPAEDIGIWLYAANSEDVRIEGNDFNTFWAVKYIPTESAENTVIRNNSFYNCVEPFETLQGWDFDIENNTAPNFDNFTTWENDHAETSYSCSLTGLDGSTKYGVIAETENNGDDSWGRANYFTTLGAENMDLSEPENDSSTSLRPTFKWSDIKTRSYYKLQVDTSDNFDNANIIDHNLMENEYTPAADLDNATQHWWRVTVYPSEQTSEVWIFTTIPPEWRHIENWTGTIEAFATWELITTWTGTIEALVAWQLIETWTGTVEAFAQWNIIEAAWSGTIETHAQWNLIESWCVDAVTTEMGYYAIGGETHKAISWYAFGSQFEMPEYGTANSITWYLDPAHENENMKVALHDSSFNLLAEGELVSFGSTSSDWYEVTLDTNPLLAGGENYWLVGFAQNYYVGTPVYCLYDVSGNATQGAYEDLEVADYPAFPFDPWTPDAYQARVYSVHLSYTPCARINAPANWEVVETWTGAIKAFSEWNLIETWTGTVEAYAAWNLIETAWSGTIEAFAEWELIETWTGTLQHKLATVTTESATSIGQTFATLNALVTYGSYENVDIRFQYRVDGASTWENAAWENDYTAILYSDTVFGLTAGTTYEFRAQIEFGAFSDNGAVLEFTTQALAPDWELLETWTGGVETQVQWNLEETWVGTIDTQVAWNLLETWTGTVESLPSWLSLEDWAGTIEAYVAPEEEVGPSGPSLPEEPDDEEPTPTMIPLGIGAVWSLLLAVCFIWLSAFKAGSRKRRWARNFIYIIGTSVLLTLIYMGTEGIVLSPITMVVGAWILIFVVAILHLSSIEAGSWRQKMTKQFFCVLITLTVLTLIYLGVI